MYDFSYPFAVVYVSPDVGGYTVTVQNAGASGYCSTTKKIPLNKFQASPKLKWADLHAYTACGEVRLRWDATGDMKVYTGGVHRRANVYGYVGGRYHSDNNARIGFGLG